MQDPDFDTDMVHKACMQCYSQENREPGVVYQYCSKCRLASYCGG